MDTDVHDGSGRGVGNSNSRINVGEAIDLEVKIKNNGDGIAYNITGKLELVDSRNYGDNIICDITDSTESITSLSPGSSDELDDFDVTGIPSDKELNFKLTVTYYDNPESTGIKYEKEIKGGDLDLKVYPEFTPAFSASYNSIIDEYTVYFYFNNIGDGQAYNVNYTFYNRDSSYCSIANNNLASELFSIAAGASKDLFFDFSVITSPPDGIFNFTFYLDYEDSAGNSYNCRIFNIGVNRN